MQFTSKKPIHLFAPISCCIETSWRRRWRCSLREKKHHLSFISSNLSLCIKTSRHIAWQLSMTSKQPSWTARCWRLIGWSTDCSPTACRCSRAGGHMTEAPATLTYASVIARETVRRNSVQLFFTCGEACRSKRTSSCCCCCSWSLT